MKNASISNTNEFTKYVPPHIRRKERRRRRNKHEKQPKKIETPHVDLQDENHFPVLNNDPSHDTQNLYGNENWAHESKMNLKTDDTQYADSNEKIQFGNITFNVDKNVENGWLV